MKLEGRLMMRWGLVTGAAGGIGEGIARVLAADGWKVAVNDLDSARAERVAKEIGGLAVPGDVDTENAEIIGAVVEAVQADSGQLGALVNNAGMVRRQALDTVAADQLDLVYRVNLRAPILLSQAALPHLRVAGGSIVNISSIAALSPFMGGGLYSASKAGLASFTQQAAVEWGPSGVRVNAIAPGMIRSGLSEDIWQDPELVERRRRLVPLGRIGDPEDIGRVVSFLVSDAAAFVTGQLISVDGGFTQVLLDQMPHTPP
jgi:NAD(P)-dependent dehydrogenase (short-subunit alcohol dehydrogenase family)